MPADVTSHYTQDSKEKETKIDNINEKVTSVGLTLKRTHYLMSDRGQ